MSDLVAFLAARLDEDEAAAVAAGHADGSAGIAGHSHWKAAYGTVVDAEDLDWAILVETLDEIGAHIARQDPARVLREVEAKRAVLDLHAACYPTTYPEPSGQPTCAVCHAGGWDWEPENWPCPTVRAIAHVYSDHPDYGPDWAVQPPA